MALKARALYSFQGENKEEIDIVENEELNLLSDASLDGWLQGTNSRGQTGLFPASYVEIQRPRSGSVQVDYPRHHSTHTDATHHGSYDDDEEDDDDWDDWDDSQSVAGEPSGSNGMSNNPPQHHNYSRSEVVHRQRPQLERQDSMSSNKRGSVVGRNLNRFSSFVRSGVEAFVLGDVPQLGRVGETHAIEMGSKGPQWKSDFHPFNCSVEEPTKQTKFKGIKSYISYRLIPDHTSSPVYRRYKHFDWLYNRLLHKFTVISVPHLPEKQATGRFEEDFIQKRKRRLILWMNHMTSHPVLCQYDGFQHFLSCRDDEKNWKAGKRRAERDEMVGASFLLTLQIPNEHQDLQDVEERVDVFKAFSKKMDESVLQLTSVVSELARKHLGGFRKEFQKLGGALQGLSHSFQLDPPYGSEPLVNAISHTGRTYERVGEMFAEQPKNDQFRLLDTLSLYQGLLSNFPDIIHLQKGAFTKVKESQRMTDEGRMEQEEADGIRKRCRVVGFALQAEINHFHQRRLLDFKQALQHYVKEQIIFYRRVSDELEKTLHAYDDL
uniref:Sorting nexin n=1 Tax=Leptobrachium leishanense TaxID=445787 RepID=A0A8C5Q6S1_9ANUR